MQYKNEINMKTNEMVGGISDNSSLSKNSYDLYHLFAYILCNSFSI